MNKLKATVLSLSLMTVMAGAAVSPALGAIEAYFTGSSPTTIKLIVALPSLFIILTSLLFTTISKKLNAKTMAMLGLLLYIFAGVGAGFVNNIYVLLLLRVVLGIGVGLIAPLSTGLIAYLFEKDEHPKLLGYSTAMNNLGAIIGTILSGWLVSFSWRYSFLIYLLGLFVIILVILFLPKIKLHEGKKSLDKKTLIKISPFVSAMFIVMVIFYTFPSNFSIIVTQNGLLPPELIGLIMSIQGVSALFAGLTLSFFIKKLRWYIKYFSSAMLALSFLLLSFTTNLPLIILGLMVLGIGLGTVIPVLNSQIAYHIEKEKVASAMAIMSAFLFFGQFASPLIIDSIQSLLGLEGAYIPYAIAMTFSLILLVLFLKINVVVEKQIKEEE